MKISTCLSLDKGKFPAIPFQGDFFENLEKITEIGFDGIDLMIGNPEELDQDNIIEAIHTAGFEIPAIGTGKAWSDEGLSFTDPAKEIREKAVRRIFSHLRFASRAQSQVIIGLLRGIVRPRVTPDETMGWLVTAFHRCMDKAEKYNVRVAVEPINRYETTLINSVTEGMQFIETVGSDRLGLLIDSFHMNIEEADIRESILKAGKRIYHVHYADSNRLYPGRGHFDFPDMLSSLKEAGYHDFISGEHLPHPDPITAVRNGVVYMRNLLEELS